MPIGLIKQYLLDWFDFPNQKMFCQVATSGNNVPHVRTMDLYHITNEGQIILLTETSTRKWHDLKQNQEIAICILHREYGQILASGKAMLKDDLTDDLMTKHYWDNYLDEYWRNFYLTKSSFRANNSVPSSFGVIVVEPTFWEALAINQNDFLKSIRKQYHKKETSWSQIIVDPV